MSVEMDKPSDKPKVSLYWRLRFYWWRLWDTKEKSDRRHRLALQAWWRGQHPPE
jgi:hypothetical protein